MATGKLTLGQVGELIELNRRRERYGLRGMRNPVQEVIARESAILSDPRLPFVSRFWRLGIGNRQFASLEAYLDTIPPIPTFNQTSLPLLTLVEGRIPLTDLRRHMPWLRYNLDAELNIGPPRPHLQPYWILCGLGAEPAHSYHSDRSGHDFAPGQTGLTIHEALCLLISQPKLCRRAWKTYLIDSQGLTSTQGNIMPWLICYGDKGQVEIGIGHKDLTGLVLSFCTIPECSPPPDNHHLLIT